MIEISRSLAREFRAVLRRTLMDQEPRGTWPLILCWASPGGLILQAVQGEIAVRYCRVGSFIAETIAFRSSVLTELEGKGDDPVTLESIAAGQGRASWTHAGEQKVTEFETVTPDSMPAFPGLPRRMVPLPDGFLRALGEAAKTAATDSQRFALKCMKLRGTAGEIVATDGHQLLVQGGFPLSWPDDLLVPRIAVLGCRDFAPDGPASIGRTKRHLLLCIGPWTFALTIDTKSRFPDVDTVIPQTSAVTRRLHLDPEDAAFLARTLPKLPGREEHNAPVTLDLGKQVAIRARSDEPGPATEVILSRSTASGTPVILSMDRRYLLRAVKLGFTEMQVVGAAHPVIFREGERTYVVMLLEAGAAIAPSQDMLRTSSTGDMPPEPPSSPERRNTTMPAPTTNGLPPDDPRPQDPRERNGSFLDLFAEAEALRTVLGDASTRVTRILVALRQHKRQTQAVQAAMASLRKLQIDR